MILLWLALVNSRTGFQFFWTAFEVFYLNLKTFLDKMSGQGMQHLSIQYCLCILLKYLLYIGWIL